MIDELPDTLPMLAVTLAEPTATAVTRPEDETVAAELLELAHVKVCPLMVLPLPSRATALNCTVAPV